MRMRGPTKVPADISSRAERGSAAAAIATRSKHRKRRNGWWHFQRLIRQWLIVRFRFRIRWLLVRFKGGFKRIVWISRSARAGERFHLSCPVPAGMRHQAKGRSPRKSRLKVNMALTAACDPKRSFNVGRFDCKLDVSLVGEAFRRIDKTWLAASA